ncbi:MAG: protein kinase [Planctomycetota bacterium]|nr:protein kinase [Planctomycetota bacterium]
MTRGGFLRYNGGMSGDQDDRTRDVGGSPGDEGSSAAIVRFSGGTLRAGATFEDYEILAEIGRGGMGVVYRARHRVLGRTVALKVIRAEGGNGGDAAAEIERFLREARTLAQLEHHNVVSVHHVGRSGGLCYIEMQYVDGESLAERLKRGPLEVDEAVRIVEQTARALEHAGHHGVVRPGISAGAVLLVHALRPFVVSGGDRRDALGPSRLTATRDHFLGREGHKRPGSTCASNCCDCSERGVSGAASV